MDDFAEDDVCAECGEEWCTCDDDKMEEPEPISEGLVKTQSTIGVSFKFFTM